MDEEVDKEVDFEYGCAVCAEAIEDDPLALVLFPLSNGNAWQQWFVHPRCAKLIFAESMLEVDLREELSELMVDE